MLRKEKGISVTTGLDRRAHGDGDVIEPAPSKATRPRRKCIPSYPERPYGHRIQRERERATARKDLGKLSHDHVMEPPRHVAKRVFTILTITSVLMIYEYRGRVKKDWRQTRIE